MAADPPLDLELEVGAGVSTGWQKEDCMRQKLTKSRKEEGNW